MIKIKCGIDSNSFEMFGESGDKIEIYPKKVDISLRPDELVEVTFTLAGVLLDIEAEKLEAVIDLSEKESEQ